MKEASNSSTLENVLRTLLEQAPSAHLLARLEEAEPIEVAHALYAFDEAERIRLFGVLPPESAAAILSELDGPAREQLLPRFPPERLADFLERMEPDDAADLVHLMGPELAEQVLARLHPDLRVALVHLLTFAPETAGGIMDPDVVQVQAAQTVATALEAIRSYVRKVELDEFFSIFVVNEARQLVGVVPTGRMLLAEPHQQVGEIMIPDPLAVEAHMDQEEVSRLVIDHDLVTVPVVDGQRRLIGRITVDDVVDVIQEEYEEDLGHLTGTEGEPVREFSLLQTLRVRVPWLFVAFVGEFGSAMIIRSREEFLLLVPQLAFFIPVIMAMGGNAGIQSSSLVIRGLATGEVRLSHFGSRLLREISISLCIGLIFALILVSGGAALTGIYKLGLAIGLAMMANISLASVIGIAIPMVLKRLGQDPALATGPFLTTMNDMVGILIYLVVAHAILF